MIPSKFQTRFSNRRFRSKHKDVKVRNLFRMAILDQNNTNDLNIKKVTF